MFLKVLHLCTFDNVGGAARAANRLNHALNLSGVESNMLVLYKTLEDETIHSVRTAFAIPRMLRFLNDIPLRIYGHRELEPDTPFSTNMVGYKVSSQSLVKKTQIIHIHWINYSFLSLKELHRIAALKKEVIWIMHDMWAMTGGCHNPLSCKKYEHACGACDLLGSNIDFDVSRLILYYKKKIIETMKHTVVVPSQWMKSRAEKSALFSKSKIVVIPNTIDCSYYKEMSKNCIKKKYSFYDSNKLYIAFGAHTNAAYKGVRYILDALTLINDNQSGKEVEIIVFGGINNEELLIISDLFKVHNLGQIKDDDALRVIYSMTDIFVSASLQESFGQVLTEAMACKTACVAFANSGSLDIIEHLESGYLAEYKSVDDVARGVQYYLDNEKLLESTKNESRSKVLNEYDYSVVSNSYLKLYENLTT